jgi:hypothetical protein
MNAFVAFLKDGKIVDCTNTFETEEEILEEFNKQKNKVNYNEVRVYSIVYHKEIGAFIKDVKIKGVK